MKRNHQHWGQVFQQPPGTKFAYLRRVVLARREREIAGVTPLEHRVEKEVPTPYWLTRREGAKRRVVVNGRRR